MPNDEGHENVKSEAARPLRRMSSTTQDSSEDQIWVAICILVRSSMKINLSIIGSCPVMTPSGLGTAELRQMPSLDILVGQSLRPIRTQRSELHTKVQSAPAKTTDLDSTFSSIFVGNRTRHPKKPARIRNSLSS